MGSRQSGLGLQEDGHRYATSHRDPAGSPGLFALMSPPPCKDPTSHTPTFAVSRFLPWKVTCVSWFMGMTSGLGFRNWGQLSS